MDPFEVLEHGPHFFRNKAISLTQLRCLLCISMILLKTSAINLCAHSVVADNEKNGEIFRCVCIERLHLELIVREV